MFRSILIILSGFLLLVALAESPDVVLAGAVGTLAAVITGCVLWPHRP